MSIWAFFGRFLGGFQIFVGIWACHLTSWYSLASIRRIWPQTTCPLRKPSLGHGHIKPQDRVTCPIDVSFYNSTASTWTLATPRTTWESLISILSYFDNTILYDKTHQQILGWIGRHDVVTIQTWCTAGKTVSYIVFNSLERCLWWKHDLGVTHTAVSGEVDQRMGDSENYSSGG